MTCQTDSAKVLRRAGHRVTTAKLLVLSALRHADDHLTANQVIEQVQRESPQINQSTVYRTLGALRDSRLISETYFGHGEAAYEWLGEEPHHHLFCRECGSMTELDNEVVEEFRRKLEDSHGFSAELEHLAVTGVCAGCSETRESRA